MAVIERDVVLQSVDENGRQTMDFPITRLGNVEDTADVKEVPAGGDYLPIVDSGDGGQMKKTTVAALLAPVQAAVEEARKDAVTQAQMDEAIRSAVREALDGVQPISMEEIDAIMSA